MATRADELETLVAGLPDPELAPGACCAALYENPGVRWVLGGELHPGGAETTRRALELVELRPSERLLDVGCGSGESALLAAGAFEADVVGIDLSERQLAAARAAARAERLDGTTDFRAGDATDLPFPDASVDVVLMECALSTVPDKARAAGEIARVLRGGGRLALSDVVVDDPERLPPPLRGSLAGLACIGSAMSAADYEALLADSGLELEALERRDGAAARLAERVEDRLRGARVMGFEEVDGAIELVRLAREAIAADSLGYAIFAARS